jgi:hypothetical protein
VCVARTAGVARAYAWGCTGACQGRKGVCLYLLCRTERGGVTWGCVRVDRGSTQNR